MHEHERLNEYAKAAAARYQAEQARQFLDCAINLCATSMPIRDVARLLRDHAELLEEYG
jgi:hypothetical protein